MINKPIYVLDSYAVIAYLRDEPGADRVEKILKEAKRDEADVYMHLVNLGEVYYTVFRKEGEALANLVYARVRSYPIEFVDDLSEDLLLSAARVKATYSIAYANAFSVATAIKRKGTLVSGDPELKQLDEAGLISVQWLA